MPPKKRQGSATPNAKGKKRQKSASASHTATSVEGTNDIYIANIPTSSRAEQGSQSTTADPEFVPVTSLTTPVISPPVPTVPVNSQTVPVNQINVESFDTLLDRLTSKIESIVERKIDSILAATERATQMAVGRQVVEPDQPATSTLSTEVVAGGNDSVACNTVHLGQTGNNDPGCALPLSLQTSKASALHSSVSLKIKDKIWANEFIDFRSQLNKPDESVQSPSNHQGMTSPSPPHTNKFISIEQWTDAFAMYSSVLRLKYPDEGEQLAQYGNTIRSIAKAKGNWYSYDTKFRQLRQCQLFPWDHIHHELYIQALTQKQPFRPQSFRPKPFRSQSNNPSTNNKNTCNKYNRGTHCDQSRCNYAHQCSNCSGAHPFFRCWKRSQDKSPNGSNNNSPQAPFSTRFSFRK